VFVEGLNLRRKQQRRAALELHPTFVKDAPAESAAPPPSPASPS
jgi:hypothetical protein